MTEYERARWRSIVVAAAWWPQHARAELGEHIVALGREHHDDELIGTGLAATYYHPAMPRRGSHAVA